MEISSKIRLKSKLYENLIKIEIFAKIWRKAKFSKNLDQKQNFSKFWPKSEFFGKIERLVPMEILRKFYLNRNYSKILAQIEIFPDISKSKFWKIWPKLKFLELFEIIDIFREFDQNWIIFENLTKNESFRIFD